jgi:DNA-binding LacI/PurR family transcriptional regulator
MGVLGTVTQADVANVAGVSQGAVSAVLGQWNGERLRLSDETIKKIRMTAESLGYSTNRAAQQLRGHTSMLLALLVGRGSPPVLFDRLSALEDEASSRGYRVLVVRTDHNPERMKNHVADLRTHGVDGIICMSHEYYADPSYVPKMLSDFKRVLYLRQPEVDNAAWIHIDGASCIYQAIDHLRKQGRSRICVQISDEVHPAYVDRLNAYFNSMSKFMPDLGRELVWVYDRKLCSDPQEPNEDVMNSVVDRYIVAGKADSIILTNDNWAAMMIKVLKSRGLRVPEDVSVIGQGNFLVGTLINPELTTLDPCTKVFAKTAIDTLVDWIENDTPALEGEVVSIKPKLIARTSA